MRKKCMLIAILASLAIANASQAANHSDFKSINEPINPRMANRSEMDAFRSDLDSYLQSINEEIANLREQQRQAINNYNKVAKIYNDEDFFHTDRVPVYVYRRKPYIFFWRNNTESDREDAYWREPKAEPRAKSPFEKQRERYDQFIDEMFKS